MVFTKAMYDDIDRAITSIKKTASDQIFVTGRVDLLWGQVEAQSNVVQVHESAIQILQSATAASTSAPCQPCGHGVSGAMGVSTDDGSSMPKPPSDGSAMSSTLLKVIGGNGQCHCVHVDTLIKQVAAIENQLKAIGNSRLRADAPAYGSPDPFATADPWGGHRPDGAGGAGGGGPGGSGGAPRDSAGKLTLPLTLREHIGSVGYKDKPMSDEKLSERAGYQYSGKAGTGIA